MSQQPRIMIADDVQMMRRLLKSLLAKADFSNIDEAANGQELLQKMNDVHYDLLICDWDMPRMSGIDVLYQIRNSEEAYKNIPFIMVTAVADADQVKKAIKAGINDYIVKPINPDAFVDKVKKALTRRDVASPAASA